LRRYLSQKTNRRTAQQRVEKARAKKRFDQVFPRLLRLQKAAKTASQLELLGKLPGFNPKLLAAIIEGEEAVKRIGVASEIQK